MANTRKDVPKTTMQITARLREAILNDRVRDETYEDIIWRWRGIQKGKPKTISKKIADKI